MRRRPAFREPRGRGLAAPVRGAMRKCGLDAPFLEAVAEPVGREGTAVVRLEKGRAARRGNGSNGFREVGMDRNVHGHRRAVLVLRLDVAHATRGDVTRPEPHDVLAPSRGVEQQSQREACFRAERVNGLVGFDLGQGPGVVTLRSVAHPLHLTRRIARREVMFDRPREQGAKRLQESVGCRRRPAPRVAHLAHVSCEQSPDQLTAMRLAGRLEPATPPGLRRRIERSER